MRSNEDSVCLGLQKSIVALRSLFIIAGVKESAEVKLIA